MLKSTLLDEDETKNLFSLRYWEKVSGEAGVINLIARKPLKVIMPLLLEKLRVYEERIFKSKYYWIHKSLPYLKLVYNSPIPEANNHDEICDLGDKSYDKSRKDHGFEGFLIQT